MRTWESIKIGVVIFLAILVIPEVCGHAGERLDTHQLTTLIVHMLAYKSHLNLVHNAKLTLQNLIL